MDEPTGWDVLDRLPWITGAAMVVIIVASVIAYACYVGAMCGSQIC